MRNTVKRVLLGVVLPMLGLVGWVAKDKERFTDDDYVLALVATGGVTLGVLSGAAYGHRRGRRTHPGTNPLQSAFEMAESGLRLWRMLS